jgi:hypothetical protein
MPNFIFSGERQAHAPLEASGEDAHGVGIQIGISSRKHSRFQWLHDAICSMEIFLFGVDRGVSFRCARFVRLWGSRVTNQSRWDNLLLPCPRR